RPRVADRSRAPGARRSTARSLRAGVGARRVRTGWDRTRMRRRVGLTLAFATGVALLTLTTAPHARPLNNSLTSEAKGYQFLDQMMDKYATGSTLRLVQSYEGGYLGRQGFTDSFTYDDALVIDALLARGQAGDVARAEVLGNS